MAQPPGGGSLADQMTALQKRVDRREKRRASDRRERSVRRGNTHACGPHRRLLLRLLVGSFMP